MNGELKYKIQEARRAGGADWREEGVEIGRGGGEGGEGGGGEGVGI